MRSAASTRLMIAGIGGVMLLAVAVAIRFVVDSDEGEEERELDPRLAEVTAQDMSDFQRGLLADNELTDAEYDAAFREFERCVDESGAVFIQGTTSPDSDGVYRAGISVPPTTQGVNRFAWQAVFECRRDNFMVAQQWRVVERVRGDPAEDSFDEAVAACIRQSGHEFDGDLADLAKRILDPQPDEHSAKYAEMAPLNYAMIFCSMDLAVLYDRPPGAMAFPQSGG
jgi:hypothetical protein